MSLNLRINIPSQGATKVIRFPESMSVHEACKTVAEKTTVGGKDHGLFQPKSPDVPEGVGKWLAPEKSLEFYDLKTNDLLDYKKKHETLKIKFMDDTVKTMLIDTTRPVYDVVDFIGQKIGLKDRAEFGIQAERNPGMWLRNTVPLPEQVPTMEQTFVYKKRFFSELNVDDPVQLHLIYSQSRDDVVAGKHPVSEDEAVLFAGIQAQVQVGDCKISIHQPGFLNVKEYLPPFHQRAEKNIYAEWKKLNGLTETEARRKYLDQMRTLKTFGMTVFNVKERLPGKKNLTPATLAFTKDTITRIEYETKRVLKEYPFKYLHRWAASPETLTLDFGNHEEDYVVVVTTEGAQIANFLSAFVDVLLKKKRDTDSVVDEDGAQVGNIQSLTKMGGVAVAGQTASASSGDNSASYTAGINDAAGAAKAVQKMMDDLFGEVQKQNDSNLTPAQRREQLEGQAKNLGSIAEALESVAKNGERTAVIAAAKKMAAAVEQMIGAARSAAAVGGDPDGVLMASSKAVADALRVLLEAAQVAASKPGDLDAKEALARAHIKAQAAISKLGAASRGIYDDEGFQTLFLAMAKAVSDETKDIVKKAESASASVADPAKKQQIMGVAKALDSANDAFANITNILSPVASDAQCKNTIEKAGKGLEQNVAFLLAAAKSVGVDPNAQAALQDAQKRLQQALDNLLGVTDLPQLKGAKNAEDFTEAAQAILQGVASLLAAKGNPQMIKKYAGEMKNAVVKLQGAGKEIVANQSDPASRERATNYLKGVIEGMKKSSKQLQQLHQTLKTMLHLESSKMLRMT